MRAAIGEATFGQAGYTSTDAVRVRASRCAAARIGSLVRTPADRWSAPAASEPWPAQPDRPPGATSFVATPPTQQDIAAAFAADKIQWTWTQGNNCANDNWNCQGQ
jgi:hypothetical protein